MNSEHTFIIAEAGSNWRMGTMERDLKMAKILIDIASESGADAIKFQTYKAETVYVPNAGNSNYLSDAGIKESITKIFQDLSMPYEMIPILAEYCKEKEIQFMSTSFSLADIRAIDPFVEIHKIASYEITHLPLIEFVAKTKKPLILSTGASTLEEIEFAVNYFYQKGGTKIYLMQTTAKYPAPLSTLNLKTISTLIDHFKIKVGLSDHSRDPIIGPVSAVALGAKIIEKHFTLDNKLPGPDHFFALMPNELKIMVQSIRGCEKSLGSGIKVVLPEEIELREYAQRRIQAISKIEKGEVFVIGKNIDILRPGKQNQGLHPKFLDQIVGKTSQRDILLGDGIQKNDY
jgi:sialic acid synthase SpsE